MSNFGGPEGLSYSDMERATTSFHDQQDYAHQVYTLRNELAKAKRVEFDHWKEYNKLLACLPDVEVAKCSSGVELVALVNKTFPTMGS